MITDGIMTILHNAIQIYDKRCEKEYLIVFGAKKNTNYKTIQIKIKQSEFWHLLGCKLEKDTSQGKRNTYLKCKNYEDIKDKIYSIHSFTEIEKKYDALRAVFDFVDKAHQIKVGYTVNCPEEYIFKVGSGDETGIIGYNTPNTGGDGILFPISAQLKPLSTITNTTYRIFLILSKDIGDKSYKHIEYEIKKGIYADIKRFIPEAINISQSIE